MRYVSCPNCHLGSPDCPVALNHEISTPRRPHPTRAASRRRLPPRSPKVDFFNGLLTAACSYQHVLHRNAVGVVRFELTISCSQGRRIPRLSHTPHLSIQRESNPHFRHGKPAGFRYIMDANVFIGLSKNYVESTGWDSNPRCRITGAESSPLNDQCLRLIGIRRT